MDLDCWRCQRQLLNSCWSNHVTNQSVCKVTGLLTISDYLSCPSVAMLHGWMLRSLQMVHLIHTGRAPQYLVDTVQSVTTSSRKHLRSSETTDYVKRTTRTKLSHSGPAAWNSLPSHLRTIIDTNVFKRHLKAFLFTESFA